MHVETLKLMDNRTSTSRDQSVFRGKGYGYPSGHTMEQLVKVIFVLLQCYAA